MIISFFLIILMAQTKQQTTSTNGSSSNLLLGSILAVSCAFGASIKAVTTRRMQDVHFSVLMFHYTLFQMVVLLLPLIYVLFITKSYQLFSYTPIVYAEMILSSLPNAFG